MPDQLREAARDLLDALDNPLAARYPVSVARRALRAALAQPASAQERTRMTTDPDAVWWAVAVGERGDAAGRRAGAVRWFDWWLRGDPARLPVTVADGPGDIEHADGTTGHLASAATGIALLMLAKDGPPPIPRRPELGPWLAPLRGRDLVCWCPLDQPCHADVLLELANR